MKVQSEEIPVVAQIREEVSMLQLEEGETEATRGDAGTSLNCSNSALCAMFDRVLRQENAFYRSEQRGSADLTRDEKQRLLYEIYMQSPGLFLSRYHQYLVSDDCKLFTSETSPDIEFYVKKIEIGDRWQTRRIRNRRFVMLNRLERDGYFSDEQMKEREPLLFERMIERNNLADQEQRTRTSNDTLSSMLIALDDSKDIADRKLTERELETKRAYCDTNRFLQHANLRMNRLYPGEEEPSLEEEEEKMTASSLEEEEEKMTASSSDEEIEGEGDTMQQQRLRHEFMSIMKERFLSGRDGDFIDYATIDDDVTLDMLNSDLDRDIEDAYFDSD